MSAVPETSPLLRVEDLKVHFPVNAGLFGSGREVVRAVDGVGFTLAAGETLGLVGESGCGKTTLGRTVIRLLAPTSGRIEFEGTDLVRLGERQLRPLRRRFQMIFQDPYGSLDPRMTVGEILGEALDIHRLSVGTSARRERIAALLSDVGLDPDHATRYPHEFSGGQRQRIGIARALAPQPDLLVADEPVSALDLSVRAQIVNLLANLQQSRGIAMLFIAHDLALVEQIADRIAVLYLGRIVEEGPAPALLGSPLHPYTASLIAAVPRVRPAGETRAARPAPGEPPSASAPPPGCPFHPRCPIARERCRSERPELLPAGAARRVACHFPGELRASALPVAESGTFSPV